MFEIKYDRNGVPIKNEAVSQEVNAQAESVVEQPVQHDEGIAESLNALQESSSEFPANEQSTDHEPEEPATQPVARKQAKPAQQSWSELRQQREEEKTKRQAAERERDEAVNYIRQLHSQAQNNLQEPNKSSHGLDQVDEFNIPDDEIVEGKHVKKVVNEYKKLRQEFNEYKQKSTVMTIEATIRAKFPDFENVVTQENLRALKESDPETASVINSSPDLYAQAAAAYKAIKKLPGLQEVESQPVPMEKSMAQKNAAKPKPLASVSPQQGSSPLSKANAFAQGLTKELADQLRKEMEEARRQY